MYSTFNLFLPPWLGMLSTGERRLVVAVAKDFGPNLQMTHGPTEWLCSGLDCGENVAWVSSDQASFLVLQDFY